MPRQHNSRAAKYDRLARRATQIDPERLDLLRKILEESSSISLNDGANPTSARQALDSHSKLLDLIEKLRHIEEPSNPRLPDRSDQSWAKFFHWIDGELSAETKLQHSKLSDSIGVTNQSPKFNSFIDKQEFSLVAKTPFQKGQKIFSIDRKIMLSTETVTQDSDLFDFIRNDSIASTMQNVVLVLHLLNEYSRGEKSYWSPYLNILPCKILPVLRLNKEKLTHFLASSHIYEALKLIRAIARQYTYFFKRIQSTSLPLKKDFTFEYYCWGVSIVCSRQNEIPTFDRQACSLPVINALIPILDMCNHDRLSNQANFEENQSRLLACKDLAANDEITINYGCRSSGEFYIHNGFVPPEVPFDILPLTIVLNKQEPLFEAKSKLLKTLNMPIFGRFRLTHNNYENRHKRDPHLTMFLIVYFLSEEELALITSSENPVGIADEIYEYIQYKQFAASNGPLSASSGGCNGNDEVVRSGQSSAGSEENGDRSRVLIMKERLNSCLKDYLSKRASVGIALIDRALSDGREYLDSDFCMMLQHERSIYESHLINYSVK